jgi:hypothetical protein
MAKGDNEIEATEAPQAITSMDKDEMEQLEAAMLAQKTIDIRDQLDLTIDAAFVARVPFIIGGIG